MGLRGFRVFAPVRVELRLVGVEDFDFPPACFVLRTGACWFRV